MKSSKSHPIAIQPQRQYALMRSGNSFQSTGRELVDLLTPITPEDFIRHFWLKRPLHIKGHLSKFRNLFDRAAFDRAVQLMPDGKQMIRAYAGSRRTHFSSLKNIFDITAKQIPFLLKQRATIHLSDISSYDKKLQTFANAIKFQLAYPGMVKFQCFLSPGGTGYPTHTDNLTTTALQIEGKKMWRFSLKPIEKDVTNASLYLRKDGSIEPTELAQGIGPVDESTFHEVILEEGDFLYLPPGIWHNAKAIGNSLSLAISFCPTISYLDILHDLLKEKCSASQEWYQGPPLIYSEYGCIGPMPKQVIMSFHKKMDELCEIIQRLKKSNKEISHKWHKYIARIPLPFGKPQKKYKTTKPNDILRLNPNYPLIFDETVVNGQKAILIYYADKENIQYLKLPFSASPILRFISKTKSFRARELMKLDTHSKKLKWSNLKRFLYQLVKKGILEVN